MYLYRYTDVFYFIFTKYIRILIKKIETNCSICSYNNLYKLEINGRAIK